MIDLFLKLIDKGIELLREGERRKKVFFEEVVKPIQELFQKMYDDHMKTFADVRAMLLNEETNPDDISSLVRKNILFESGTLEVLYRLTSSEHLDWDTRERIDTGLKVRYPNSSLKDYFDEYLYVVASCLTSPNHGYSFGQVGVWYYAGLSALLPPGASGEDKEWERKQALSKLDHLVRSLQSYYGEVTSRYHELQRHCLT